MSQEKKKLQELMPFYLKESVIPETIKLLVEQVSLDKHPSLDDCLDIAEQAMEYKLQHYILKYEGDGCYKEPEKLTPIEAGSLVLLLFDFTMIKTVQSARDGDKLLGVYEAHGERKGLYITEKEYIRTIIQYLNPSFLNKDIDNTYGFIKRFVSRHEVYLTREEHLIPVGNGVYDKNKQELLPYSPEYVFLNKIPVAYRPEATNPVITDHGYEWDVERWLDDLLGAEEKLLIWQVIADTVQMNKNRKKSIWFYGNNGKEILGRLIKNLHGVGNYSSLNVAAFADRFAKADLLAVNCNIADKNNVDEYIDKVDDYKASIKGDDITIDQKFQCPLTIKFHGTNIQMMNGLPKIKDKTDNFTRLLLIVPFLKCFTNNGENSEIKEGYVGREDVLEYVLKTALELEFEEFIIPASSEELLSKFKEDDNFV